MYLYNVGPRPSDSIPYRADYQVFKTQLEQSYDIPESCTFAIRDSSVYLQSTNEKEFNEFVELLKHSSPRNWTVQSLTDLEVYSSSDTLESIFSYRIPSHRTRQPVFVQVGDTLFPVSGVTIDPEKPITIQIDQSPPV